MALNINGTTGISGVDGSVSAPAVTGTDSNTGITFPAADTIKFATGGVERMSITNSGISGITAGITHASSWCLNSQFTGSTTPVTNLQAYTSAFAGTLGAAMSISSGVFTFPTTGIWLISADASFFLDGDSRYNRVQWQTTNDNFSSSSNAQSGYQFIDDAGYSGAGYSSMHTDHIFDVQDTSTHKCRLKSEMQNSSTTCHMIKLYFIRLGDT